MDEAPSFHALAVFPCKANRLYRIYIRPSELIFIWAGKGSEGMAAAHAFSNGHLLHRVVGAAMTQVLDPARQNEERRRTLDHATLSRLLKDHPHNFRANTGGFMELRLGPRSDSHARGYSDHGHQALLHIRHRQLGKWRLGLASLEDTQIAYDELPRLLGSKCRVDIPQPRREQSCGCRICRVHGQQR
jgi:hypothetical protein